MKRRVALKSLAVVVAGVVFLPGCDMSSKSSVETVQSFLSPEQDALLGGLVNTIIPATDTPGAKELGVPAYIKVMVADCHEPEVQKIFFKGFATVENLAGEKYGKAYAGLTPEQQKEVLFALEASGEKADQEFYELLKGLTIQGYMSSEYVMTNHTGFEMIPGRYHGCVPVPSKQKV